MSKIELDQSLRGERVALKEIPVIDFEPFLTGNLETRQAVARQIGQACRDIGFFYLANHGIAPALMERTFAESKHFFDQPLEAKLAIDIEKSPCHRGFFKMGGENLDPAKQTAAGDLKEGIKIGRDLAADNALVQAGLPLHGPNLWPGNLPGWQGAMQSYFDALVGLGRQIMHAFALSLDLDECHFDRDLTDPMATLGPLHYPPQQGAITEKQIGAGAHTDFGCLTILAQDKMGGLQVRNCAGTWIDAPPIEGAFVVNIGDMMARWTNDLYASTRHRVINVSNLDRYSIPFFYDPDFDAEVSCLETCVSPERPANYPPTTGGQHLLDMIDSTFEYRGKVPG